jgi:hypothetical protein
VTEGTIVRTSTGGRLAIAIVGIALGSIGCGTAPSASPVRSSPSPSPASASAGTGVAGLVWPAPADPMGLTVQAGLKPQPKEFLTNHVHAHLDVFVDGKVVVVPAGIGIKIDDPAVQIDDMPDGSKRYGGINLCNEPCISPLHTHGTDGILHTESSSPDPNTLGEFFTEWGVALDASCVATYCSPATTIAIYVDGQLSTGDPRGIKLIDQREIAIVIGTPPPSIPRSADFTSA